MYSLQYPVKSESYRHSQLNWTDINLITRNKKDNKYDQSEDEYSAEKNQKREIETEAQD